jgi:uncharacterized protein
VALSDRWQRGELEVLSEDECRQLVAGGGVGRVGYNDDRGPVVTPVNFSVDNGAVLIATSPESELGRHAPEASVALEVDDLDPEHRAGWSVVVRGVAEVVPYAELPSSHDGRPSPWAAGDRALYLRITPTSLSGRRVLPA